MGAPLARQHRPAPGGRWSSGRRRAAARPRPVARPSRPGSTGVRRTSPSSRSHIVDVVVVVSSSRPSSPWTTSTWTAPWLPSTSSIRSAIDGSATPTTIRRTRPGLAIGPRMLKAVGMPSSRRDGPAWRSAGWKRGAKQKAMPATARHSATPAGLSSRFTPRASRRSAEPQLDDAARLPCLHTGTPAPATTRLARVETLMVWLRSPPVPTTSTARARTSSSSGTSSAAASMAARSPVSSSTDSPFMRSATTKPASCAGVAVPCRISAMAARACSVVRSRPASSGPSTAGQPPSSASSSTSGDDRGRGPTVHVRPNDGAGG